MRLQTRSTRSHQGYSSPDRSLHLLLQKLRGNHLMRRRDHSGHCRGHTHGCRHRGHRGHLDHSVRDVVCRRRRVLTSGFKLISIILQVIIIGNRSLTVLLGLVDATVPGSEISMRSSEQSCKVSLLCEVVGSRKGFAAVWTGVRSLLRVGTHMPKRPS
jgi:hypothetical protein